MGPRHRQDSEPEPATLRSNLSRLRRALGPGHLPDADPAGYHLQDVTVDWAVFQHLADQARTHTDPIVAAALSGQALALVRGLPYETDSGYGWVDHEDHRNHIELAVTDLANRLAHIARQQGQPDLALWAACQGLLANPLDETLAVAALTSARATGRAGALAGEWRHTVRRLAARGLQPSPELETEHDKLARLPANLG